MGGNPAGDVTVVEFFDYRCPHCRRMAPVIKTLLTEDPRVRLVYKELPILGEESVLAARAALAARGQGKYVGSPRPPHGRDRAPHEGVGRRDARGDRPRPGDASAPTWTRPRSATLIGRELALAQALGIDGTPAFVVGGELVVGAVDLGTLRDLISQARRAP